MSDFSSIVRNAKNKIYKFSLPQVKVREATSNDPWNPSSDVLVEIATLSYDPLALEEMMVIIMKRVNDFGKNWRHVYKSLILLEYMSLMGDYRVQRFCIQNKQTIESLKSFQFIDKDNRDHGQNVREKAKSFSQMLDDEEIFKSEREKHLRACEHTQPHLFAQLKRNAEMQVPQSGQPKVSNPSAGRPAKQLSMSTTALGNRAATSNNNRSARWTMSTDISDAIPKNDSEEEAQLQVALAISKEEDEIKRGVKASSPVHQPVVQLQKPSAPPPQLLDFGTTETFVNPVTIHQESMNPFFADPFAVQQAPFQQTPQTITPLPSPSYSTHEGDLLFSNSQPSIKQMTSTTPQSDTSKVVNNFLGDVGGNLLDMDFFEKGKQAKHIQSSNPFEEAQLNEPPKKPMNDMFASGSNPQLRQAMPTHGSMPSNIYLPQQQQPFGQPMANQPAANTYYYGQGQYPQQQFRAPYTQQPFNSFGQNTSQQSAGQPIEFSQGYSANRPANSFQQQNQTRPFFNQTRFA